MSQDEMRLPAPDAQAGLRARAIKQIQKRKAFRAHLLVYVLVNALLVGIWAVSVGPDGFFWPVFPILGWGIAIVAQWYDTYRGGELSEDAIQHEMDRMAGRR